MSDTIKLKYAEIIRTSAGCRTVFHDGASCDAAPHTTHHYHVIAHRCGYSDDVMRYCIEHEFFHEFACEKLCGRTSDVLWSLAHGRLALRDVVIMEELTAQAFQRWVRANERPIVSGGRWDAWKDEAIELLRVWE